jgi:hypothetical protein
VGLALLVGYVAIRLLLDTLLGAKEPEVKDYRRDEFEGLIWYWSWNYFDAIDNLYCCCPTCELQLIGKLNYAGYPTSPQLDFFCESCRGRKAVIEGDHNQVEQRIQRLIQQKIRTGSWRSVIQAGA